MKTCGLPAPFEYKTSCVFSIEILKKYRSGPALHDGAADDNYITDKA